MKRCRMCGAECFGEVCGLSCSRRLVASQALRLAVALDHVELRSWATSLREAVDDLLERGGEPTAWCGVARLLERVTSSLEPS